MRNEEVDQLGADKKDASQRDGTREGSRLTLRLGEELCRVGEVLDEPRGYGGATKVGSEAMEGISVEACERSARGKERDETGLTDLRDGEDPLEDQDPPPAFVAYSKRRRRTSDTKKT